MISRHFFKLYPPKKSWSQSQTKGRLSLNTLWIRSWSAWIPSRTAFHGPAKRWPAFACQEAWYVGLKLCPHGSALGHFPAPKRFQSLRLFAFVFLISYCWSQVTHGVETPWYLHQNCVQTISSSSHGVPDANPRLEEVATYTNWLGLWLVLADTCLQPRHGNRVSCEDLPTPRMETKENISKFCVPRRNHVWLCIEKKW